MIEVCHTLPVRPGLTPEQLDTRRRTLGSSEIAAVAGVSPYQSCHQVWLAKVMGQDFEGNEATRLGNLLEPTILAIYADRYSKTIRRGQYTVGRESWMSCTPDGVIDGEPGDPLVEAKLVGLRSIWMWGQGNTDESESDAVPVHYLCQAYWQLEITGAPFVDVAALLGTEFRTYRIRQNAAVQSQLVARGRDFWQRYVVTQTPPPVDGSDGAKEMLKALYPRSGGETVEADERLRAMVDELRVARAEEAKAKEARALRENRIKELLGDARGAFGPGWRIRYATTKAGTRPFVLDDQEEKGRAA